MDQAETIYIQPLSPAVPTVVLNPCLLRTEGQGQIAAQLYAAVYKNSTVLYESLFYAGIKGHVMKII